MSNEVESQVEGQAEGTVSGPIEASSTRKRAKSLGDREFFKLHEASATRTDALKATGFSRASYDQRCAAMRAAGWPMKYFSRLGGTKVTPDQSDELLAEIAAIKGMTVEEVKAASLKLQAEAAERKAEAEAEKAKTATAGPQG